ncbi:MAG: M3 family metallopeptidase [Rubrivivax sp.]|nr:M3 family metallopeptidase [Rubrivivax sp.]
MNDNPLLADTPLPRFDLIRPQHVAPAVDLLLADAEAALRSAGSDTVAADYDALERVLGVPVERLQRAWGTVGHLQSVADTPALRAAYEDQLPRVTDFHTRLDADQHLYAKTRIMAGAPAFEALSPARRKVVQDALRDFELGGAALQGAARERFAQIRARRAELSQRFGNNVLDATDAWSLVVDEHRLAGVPADVVQAARDAASRDGLDGCKLSLQAPCRVPVLTYADDRSLREMLFTAHSRLASEWGPAEWDNGPLISELLSLRQEEADLLGRDSYAELSLAAKMARTPEEVLTFLRDLAARARPQARAELAELQAFAREQFGIDAVQAWDRAYVAEKLKLQRHGLDAETLRPYFTEPQVLSGLFDLLHKLFGLQIRLAPSPGWHPSVRYYDIQRDGQPVGGFYLDLHARAGKQSGAWMDEARGRWRRPDGQLQHPAAYLVCNFAPPVGERPALLSHDDVVTLFHEFGHGLHHLLTQVDERAVAGISGVEWDACELPSQFMENFAWAWPVLQSLSAHVDTGEPLPEALYAPLLATRRFQAGLQMLRGVEYSLFDMRLHAERGHVTQVAALALAVQDEVALLPRPPGDRWPNGFTHIFDGGYAAGYYGYLWAEVLAADAFAAFEERGLFDPETGRRWRQAVLEVGGSRPALDSFRAFRGRAPSIDALLRQQGLTDGPSDETLERVGALG